MLCTWSASEGSGRWREFCQSMCAQVGELPQVYQPFSGHILDSLSIGHSAVIIMFAFCLLIAAVTRQIRVNFNEKCTCIIYLGPNCMNSNTRTEHSYLIYFHRALSIAIRCCNKIIRHQSSIEAVMVIKWLLDNTMLRFWLCPLVMFLCYFVKFIANIRGIQAFRLSILSSVQKFLSLVVQYACIDFCCTS